MYCTVLLSTEAASLKAVIVPKRRYFANVQAAMAAASAPEPDELVELNVGGSVFLTTRATLCAGAEPSSMLSALLNSGLPSSRDSCGRLFIDRDGTRFRHVLNYLRSGALHHDGDRVALQELKEEAMYFGVLSAKLS